MITYVIRDEEIIKKLGYDTCMLLLTVNHNKKTVRTYDGKTKRSLKYSILKDLISE